MQAVHVGSTCEHTNMQAVHVSGKCEHTNMQAVHVGSTCEHTNMQAVHVGSTCEHTNMQAVDVSTCIRAVFPLQRRHASPAAALESQQHASKRLLERTSAVMAHMVARTAVNC
jgi:hypothetical protein